MSTTNDRRQSTDRRNLPEDLQAQELERRVVLQRRVLNLGALADENWLFAHSPSSGVIRRMGMIKAD